MNANANVWRGFQIARRDSRIPNSDSEETREDERACNSFKVTPYWSGSTASCAQTHGNDRSETKPKTETELNSEVEEKCSAQSTMKQLGLPNHVFTKTSIRSDPI